MVRRKQGVDGGAGAGGAARRETGGGAARGGFTLIELMVVVTIIVVLIGILLPALGAARIQARVAQTQSLMSNLMADIDAYFQRFHAYPGPVSAANTTTGNPTSITGSQNMLLGLSYAVVANGGNPTLPGGCGVKSPLQPSGPIDNASIKADGNPEQLPTYFTPQSKQIAMINGAGLANFPVVVDAFPDGLPILYYRRMTGVESPMISTGQAGTAAYFLSENRAYTNASALVSTSGTAFNETLGSFANGTTDFQSDVTVGVNGPVHGGYVLISAGPDRYYGAYNGKMDDIVKVGGD